MIGSIGASTKTLMWRHLRGNGYGGELERSKLLLDGNQTAKCLHRKAYRTWRHLISNLELLSRPLCSFEGASTALDRDRSHVSSQSQGQS